MTKTQLRKKFRELHKQNRGWLDQAVEKVIKSGAVDLTDYDDDYVLAKIIMCAACKSLAEQWRPLQKHYDKVSKNLEHFI